MAKKTCEKCHLRLASSEFGQLTDNSERVFISDPVCRKCRAFEERFWKLVGRARIAMGRLPNRQDHYQFTADVLGRAQATIANVLQQHRQETSPSVLEELAVLVVGLCADRDMSHGKAEVESILRALLDNPDA